MREKIRVLVVEENANLCNDIRELLELDGYHALACTDARIARLVLATYSPQVVIISYGFYNSYAYEVLIGHCQNLYPSLYLCSESAYSRLLHDPLLNQEDIILTKPFDAEEMMNAIVKLSESSYML